MIRHSLNFGWYPAAALMVLLILVHDVWADTGFTIEAAPDWVVSHELPDVEPLPQGEGSDGCYYTLLDHQVLVDADKLQQFNRIAFQVVNAEGVERSGQLYFDFEPNYESLVFHSVDIIRKGKIISQLAPDRITLLHREEEAEQLMINGRKTASIILDDLRIGDTVTYSYSIIGGNPVFDGQFFTSLKTQWSVPLQHVFYRIIWNKKTPLHFRYLNDAPEPVVHKTGQGLEYRWKLRKIKGLRTDDSLPGWYNPYPRIQVSEFDSWQSVLDWALELYRVSPDQMKFLQREANKITAKSSTGEESILALIRFVQDDIRYLGIESGLGSHQPRSPELVMQRRYGDCKDKSLLLSALLRAKGIEAWPALVNTAAKQAIKQYQPSPAAFNHVIVALNWQGRLLWLDPTEKLQRGLLEELEQARFGTALPIREGKGRLVDIPAANLDNPNIEITEYLDLSKGPKQPSPYTITYRFLKDRANVRRRYIANTSRDEIVEKALNFYADSYPSIEIDRAMTIDDDIRRNVIETTEHYTIMDLWNINEEKKRYEFDYDALDIYSFMERPRVIKRSMPFSLSFPLFVRQVSELNLPSDNWELEDESAEIHNDYIHFTYASKKKDAKYFVTYTLQTLQDHVPTEDILSYLRDLDKIGSYYSYIYYQELEDERERKKQGPPTLFQLFSSAFTELITKP